LDKKNLECSEKDNRNVQSMAFNDNAQKGIKHMRNKQ